MMPKGVEHEVIRAMTTEATDVRIPMMPKGVEHECLLALRRGRTHTGENSDDAERR